MKLDFDIDSVEHKKINLLNCQVDLILRSLEFYAYTYQYIYPRRRKSESDEENLRIYLVRDTYHQICNQLHINETNNEIIQKLQEDFKKVA